MRYSIETVKSPGNGLLACALQGYLQLGRASLTLDPIQMAPLYPRAFLSHVVNTANIVQSAKWLMCVQDRPFHTQ